MAEYLINQLYLGNYSDLDPIESKHKLKDFDSENTTAESKTPEGANWGPGRVIDTSATPVVEIVQHDVIREGKDFRLEEDDIHTYTVDEGTLVDGKDADGAVPETPPDTYTYTHPVTGVTKNVAIDSSFHWKATVAWADGTSSNHTVSFVQMQNGDIFTNWGSAVDSDERGLLDSKPIASVTLNYPLHSNWYGAQSKLSLKPFGRQSVDDVACFDGATMIKTAEGDCAIRDLVIGQQVVTLDGGLQPVRWIGCRNIGSTDLLLNPNLRPIRIRADALGVGYPTQDLVVSPQHRILVRSTLAQRMFSAAEVLIAAKHLLGLPGIEVANDLDEVEYYHILFDRHQLIWSNGAATESLYIGAEALKSLAPEQVAEIFGIFPELRDLQDSMSGEIGHRFAPARPLVPGRKGRNFARRLQIRQNRHALNNGEIRV